MGSHIFIEVSGNDTTVLSADVERHRTVQEPQDVGIGIDHHEERVSASPTELRIPSPRRRRTRLREHIRTRTRSHSRGSNQRVLCEASITHGFQCVCLDRKNLPSSFQMTLKTLIHILGYLHIPDALLKLERSTQEDILISRRLVPDFTHLMQMGLGWHISYVQPFFALLVRYCGLQQQVFCETGQGDVDFVIALRNMSEKMTPKDSSAPQNACTSCVPMCPVMVMRHPHDDPIARLKGWLPGHLHRLETNSLIPDVEHWPVPYFLVDNDKWKVGFAIQSGADITLYDEFIGSMGWRNGVRKIVVILQIVVESAVQRQRQWLP